MDRVDRRPDRLLVLALGLALCAMPASLVTGCGDDDAPAGDDAGPAADAGGRDSGPALEAGTDASGADGGVTGVDSGALDAAALDAGSASTDAGPGRDGAPTNECEARGGTCVPVVPGACASGVFGDPRWCTDGLGVTCCLPSRLAPECQNVGTTTEGWYGMDGMRICLASCSGSTATCEAIGTRSEGWYASGASAGCPMGPAGRLIEWTDCAP